MWKWILSLIGAGSTKMSLNAACEAVMAGRLTIAQGAAACGYPLEAFKSQLRAATFEATELARQAARQTARRGFIALGELNGAAIAAGIVVLGAIAVGVYMYQNWDKPSVEPVKAGPAGNPSLRDSFAGTWMLSTDHRTATLDAKGNGSWAWNPGGGQSDTGNYSGCVAKNANTVSCDWSGTYIDKDKTIIRHGTFTMTVNQGTLSVTECAVTKIDSESWKVPKYPSGAEVCGPSTWTRT